MEKVLIGWAEESLVPDMKVALAGQFYERISEYVESDITATAMAIDNGEENYNELDFSTLLNEGIASSVNTAANRYISQGVLIIWVLLCSCQTNISLCLMQNQEFLL